MANETVVVACWGLTNKTSTVSGKKPLMSEKQLKYIIDIIDSRANLGAVNK